MNVPFSVSLSPTLQRPIRGALILAALLVMAEGAPILAQGGAALRIRNSASRTPAPTSPPVIQASLPSGTVAFVGEELRFTVSVDHPAGHPVSLTLLDPPPGLIFHPVVNASPPRVEKVRWCVPPSCGGLRRLVFHAREEVPPFKTVTLELALRVTGSTEHNAVQIGDVTGDGTLDVIVGARPATVGGVPGTGAVYLWAGTTVPTGTPTATLAVPGAAQWDQLGSVGFRTGIQLADVTGDGVLDVVVGSSWVDLGGMSDVGALYVWQGGPSLSGSVPPTASLTVPGAVQMDQLGNVTSGQGIELVDVTGDGTLDVIAGASNATIAGVQGAGAVYVWAGGPALIGTVAPTATLTVPGASAWDNLGAVNWDGQGIQLADVTGNGYPDVIAGASYVTVGAVQGAGAIYVWAGGPSLVGGLAPTATLTVPGAVQGDLLGNVFSGVGIRLAEVTGGGALDVVAGTSFADAGGVQDTGAVYVWAGGPSLVGSVAPTATLTVAGAVPYDNLCSGGGHVLHLADMTGDSTLDVIALAANADVGGVPGAGACYLWAGGPALTGTPAPTAILTVPGAAQWDGLGQAYPQGTQLLDVSGDGILDLVVATPAADIGGVMDAGAVYAWAGGPSLTGSVSPTATLTVPGAVSGDQLALATGKSVLLADVTGEGVPDVVAVAAYADVGGVQDTGAIHAWAGGPTLTGALAPLATLTVPGAVTSDSLGILGWGQSEGVKLADVTGDGVLDVVSGGHMVDVNGVQDTGALYAWSGGATLSGAMAPTAVLSVPGAVMSDSLGVAAGHGLRIVDVTGDGTLDLVAGTANADVAGVQDAGALYTFAGGPALAGAVVPSATLTVPGAVAWDALGSSSGQGIQIADVTGDGAPDLVVGAYGADVGGLQDTGAVYLWTGAISASAPPTVALTVPGAVTGDQLGY